MSSVCLSTCPHLRVVVTGRNNTGCGFALHAQDSIMKRENFHARIFESQLGFTYEDATRLFENATQCGDEDEDEDADAETDEVR